MSGGGTRRGTLRGVAAAADESGRRAAGLTAGAAAAWVGACRHTSGGNTRHGTLRGVAAAADEGEWRNAASRLARLLLASGCVGCRAKTAGAAAAYIGGCGHESGGGTRSSTMKGAAAAADESGRRAAGLTAGAAATCVGACGRQSGGDTRRCTLRWVDAWTTRAGGALLVSRPARLRLASGWACRRANTALAESDDVSRVKGE